MEHQQRCPEAGVFDVVVDRPVPVVVVGGVASGTGKTSAVEAMILLLRTQGKVAAVKVTVPHNDHRSPHQGRNCNVCGGPGQDFELIASASVTKQPNTDTGRFHSRGADPVLWLISGRPFVRQGWSRLKSCLRNVDAVVVESNTLAQIVEPDLLIMVADPTASRRFWKDSARELLERADLVVVNERSSEEESSGFYKELMQLRGSSAPLVRVSHPLQLEGDPLLRELLSNRRLIKSRHADLSSLT